MNRADLRVGKVYIVAGQGVGRLEVTTPLGMMFHGHGDATYWADPDQVMREATKEDLEARDAQGQPKSVACKRKQCWCRRVFA